MSLKPLLFLSPRVPWPLNTGAKFRTWALLKTLSGAFDVHYGGFLQPELDPGEARERFRICRATDLHPEVARTAPGKAWLVLRTLGGRSPWRSTIGRPWRAMSAAG